jgi:heme oxygenase
MNTLQEKLKKETAEIHKKAEDHPLMQSFIKGEYKKTHLLQYLINLRPLYETVEQRLIVKNIHENFDLCRSRLVSKDIAMVYKEGIVNSDNINILELKKDTVEWVKNQWTVDPNYLIADLYVRWLADLYGGRVFAKSLDPYINSYTCVDVRKSILEINDIVNNADVDHQVIIYRTKSFFEYHVGIFDEIYAT